MGTLADDLSPDSITRALATRFIGRMIIHLAQVASTMGAARSQALSGVAQGTVIITDEQTAGRGRLGRSWLSPRGGIYLSIVLYPAVNTFPCLIMVTSLAVIRAIKSVTGLQSQIKWPNDILIGGKKVGGILIESGLQQVTADYAIVGIGLNVNISASKLTNIAMPATSLAAELGRDISRLELTRKLLVEFERLYLSLPCEAVFQEWRSSLVTLGKEVVARSGERVYQGTAEDVASDGSLILRIKNGSKLALAAGDVTLADIRSDI
jgi:BirA family biotin operon repressor/biotin-[acetyl-CoA-carboxylase] ligase